MEGRGKENKIKNELYTALHFIKKYEYKVKQIENLILPRGIDCVINKNR